MTADPQAPVHPAPAGRSSGLPRAHRVCACLSRLACAPPWGSAGRMDGDLAEVLALLPPCLAALVELQERENSDGDGHTILATNGLLEGEVPAPEQVA